MNPVTTASTPSSIPSPDTARLLSLAERMPGRQPYLHDVNEPAPAPGQGEDDVTPLPGPVPDPAKEFAVKWARQMFIEVLMTGDEEETGITPLSIEI